MNEYDCEFDWYERDEALIEQYLEGHQIKAIEFLKKEEACILSIYPEASLKEQLEAFITKRGYYIGANAHYF